MDDLVVVERGGSIGDGGGDLGNNWGGYSLDCKGFTMYHSVETMNIISGIFDSTLETVSVDEGVGTVDGVTVTDFLGVLVVTGQMVVDAVSVLVLWVGVEWFWDDGFGGIGDWGVGVSVSDGGGVGGMGYWGGVSTVGNWGYTGLGKGQKGGECN